ncbi:hypothetical protein BV22DRAFT_85893 [Leucogyrophana mollusca]|uniref:Uncharacterized protein n=1 Tax=Leucogyrophana mollusca TaxID=85980 RepID=A0ACB8BZI8_9AGAM|nr:hypothetical protein BV22DRAFT_85893 [Leucogyrophana mollusca]
MILLSVLLDLSEGWRCGLGHPISERGTYYPDSGPPEITNQTYKSPPPKHAAGYLDPLALRDYRIQRNSSGLYSVTITAPFSRQPRPTSVFGTTGCAPHYIPDRYLWSRICTATDALPHCRWAQVRRFIVYGSAS